MLFKLTNVIPAEVASLLSRNVSYEGPALRKQLAKAQQLQQELSRREVDCQSSAADLRERYYTACKQYGITVSRRTLELTALCVDMLHPGDCFSSGRENMWPGSCRRWSKTCQRFWIRLGGMQRSLRSTSNFIQPSQTLYASGEYRTKHSPTYLTLFPE